MTTKEGHRKKQSWSNVRYYLVICLDEVTEAIKTLSRNSKFLG